jgi:hypothetical protein
MNLSVKIDQHIGAEIFPSFPYFPALPQKCARARRVPARVLLWWNGVRHPPCTFSPVQRRSPVFASNRATVKPAAGAPSLAVTKRRLFFASF